MNELKLTKEEFHILEKIILNNELKTQNKNVNSEYHLFIDDDNAELLSELIQENYIFEGFDIDYELNALGTVYRGIMRKLEKIGW